MVPVRLRQKTKFMRAETQAVASVLYSQINSMSQLLFRSLLGKLILTLSNRISKFKPTRSTFNRKSLTIR